MAVAGKRKKSQLRILNEIKNQLLLQAERWGRKDFYTPLKLEEMELDQCKRIIGEFLAERANLEYELYLIESDKHEIRIKLDKLEGYVKKAKRVISQHDKNIHKQLKKLLGDTGEADKVISAINRKNSLVSVMIGEN